ncbi:MAG: PIN domain nuclease, partial [Vicingaceae bacterium]
LSKYEKAALVKEKVQKFKVLAETADLSDKVIEQGLASNFADFEDALQYYCAIAKGCDVLISRSEKDFKMSNIPVLSPTEYLSTLQSKAD